jgi:photosystem II stability/assembly factor-like uncharacterized protein
MVEMSHNESSGTVGCWLTTAVHRSVHDKDPPDRPRRSRTRDDTLLVGHHPILLEAVLAALSVAVGVERDWHVRISRRVVDIVAALVIPALVLGAGLSWMFRPENRSTAPTGFEPDSADREDSPSRAPNDWFFTQRAFPSGRIPLGRWRAARASAAALKEMGRGLGVSIWSPRGPENIPGRITDLAVDPDNDDIVFAGTAEGGVFRTRDGGQTWTPLFDEMPVLSIGAVAIDPSNSNVVYAGTGEVNPGGGSIAYGGAGLFRSTDQGDTWSLVGLENSGSIGRIAIDPSDPLTIFVAANGMHWQPNPERGVYRTTDGGGSWERVLYVDDQTGCVDLVLRPDTPDVVFAVMWQHLRQPGSYDYGGPGCAIHVSSDGGDTWSPVGGGLPTASTNSGRIGISLCASQPDVMHAVYADRTGFFDGLYRSVDGGATWARTNDGALVDVFSSFGWWFGNVRTHPMDPDTIFVLGLTFWMSTDGGASYVNAGNAMHVDHHALEFGSGGSPVLFSGNDGGVYRSTNGGTAWVSLPNQPHTQIYRMALDQQNVNALYVGAQDNGTNRTVTGGVDDWQGVFGGDGFQTVIHPDDSNRIWAQYQYGSIFFSDNGGSTWMSATLGIPAGDRKNWNAPHVQDPTDSGRRFAGTHRVFRSIDNRTWEAISPDLTGGPSGDPGQVDGSLTAISVSPVDPNVIWAGSNDGFVNVTSDGGGAWTNVSTSLPERWVTAVKADPVHRETAYVTISGFRWNEPLPRVYMTTDLGANWSSVSGNLPDAPVNDFLADPSAPGRFFVATDVGVFVSRDRGASWDLLGPDLPNIVATSLLLDQRSQQLLVGTFGRSVFSTPIDDGLLFYDGFESGDTAGWTTVVP